MSMFHATDDLRIAGLRPLIPPAILMEELPVSARASETVTRARKDACATLRGDDGRLLAIVGPCSIHDAKAALEYGAMLGEARASASRTTSSSSCACTSRSRAPPSDGRGSSTTPTSTAASRSTRACASRASSCSTSPSSGVPAGSEFLDTITPQFIADLIGWGAIGARTTESQVHRELASGLSMPVGFKNGTDGNVRIAIDAIRAAQAPAPFPVGHEAGDLGHRRDARQPRLPRHPARRQRRPELRHGRGRTRGRRARGGRPAAGADDRLQPRQQRQGPPRARSPSSRTSPRSCARARSTCSAS